MSGWKRIADGLPEFEPPDKWGQQVTRPVELFCPNPDAKSHHDIGNQYVVAQLIKNRIDSAEWEACWYEGYSPNDPTHWRELEPPTD